MVETVISNLYSILGALALACIGGYIAWRNNFKSRRAAAGVIRRATPVAIKTRAITPEIWATPAAARRPVD